MVSRWLASILLPQVVFFSCFPWYKSAELVSWNFGPFYRELCGSPLAWEPCICLFSLWDVSYLLVGDYAFDALVMCFHMLHGDFVFQWLFFLWQALFVISVGVWLRSFVFRGLLCLVFLLFFNYPRFICFLIYPKFMSFCKFKFHQ